MSDLISRSGLLDAFNNLQPLEFGRSIAGMVALRMVNAAPSVDAEPVRHGKWEHLGGDEWCCTVCGEVIHTEGSWEKPTRKYCHECGAKMDGDTNAPD